VRLARLHRAGELTAIWVPDDAHEALRDLTRARDDARHDLQRARHRLRKFLLRNQLRPPVGVNAWTRGYRRWLEALALAEPAQRIVLQEYLRACELAEQRLARFDAEIPALIADGPLAAVWQALQVVRGVGPVTAATIVAELGDLSRFDHPRQLMAFAGLVPSEHSSGSRTQRGGITKAGNAHLRHVLVEAAWHVRHKPAVSAALKRRQRDQPQAIVDLAWRSQSRLHRRFWRLVARNKSTQQAVVAVARELVGTLWEIARLVRTTPAAA
jgi:transposase